jgi:hypothetical protein
MPIFDGINSRLLSLLVISLHEVVPRSTSNRTFEIRFSTIPSLSCLFLFFQMITYTYAFDRPALLYVLVWRYHSLNPVRS